MVEVTLFLGNAVAEPGNIQSYPPGEKHAVIVFVRQQKGTPPDFEAAAKTLEQKKWSRVSLSQAALISVENLNSVHPHAASSYEDALKTGSAALVFSDPIQ